MAAIELQATQFMNTVLAMIKPVIGKLGIGLSSFLAQLILRKPLIEAATFELLVDGTWLDPRVTKVDRRNNPLPAASAPAIQ